MTNAELERLAILAEECGEVVQIVGKIIRHGYESHNPFDESKTINRQLLEKELGDLEFIIWLMKKSDDVDSTNVITSEKQKRRKIKQYLHHNDLGALANEG
jgi:NTP pyrophosphatase (non-canonical NTP hydrolase)